MNYIPLNNEQKFELDVINRVGNLKDGIVSFGSNPNTRFTGEKIEFFYKGEPIAATDLPGGTLGEERLAIAEMIGIKEFDEYHFLSRDGDIRIKSSSISIKALAEGQHYGEYHGAKYQEFLKREK